MKTIFATASFTSLLWALALVYAFASGHVQPNNKVPSTQEVAMQLEKDASMITPQHLAHR